MRVLHIDRLRGWGGRGNRTLQILTGLQERGVDVTYVTHQESATAKRARDAGVPTVELALRGARLYASALSVRRLALDRRFDVVHCHASRDQSIGLFLRMSRACPRLIRTCHNPPRLRSGPLSRLQYDRVDAIVAVSNFVREAAVSAGIHPSKVHTIHDSVDVRKFLPREETTGASLPPGFRPDAIRIGHVSRLAEQKGVEPLLRAIAQIVHGGGANVQCILVGAGDARWKPLVEELALEPHVLFTGFREDVDHLLPWFDIFALTPIRAEALGTAYLEALAAGLPIIGSTIGGVREIVSDDVGVLVPPRDVDALAGALLALISDEAARARRGRAARALAIDRFSTTRMVESTLDLYRQTTSTPAQTT